jgi:DNA-binding transcriptional LysR family regulator
MVAVLPRTHSLAHKAEIRLQDLIQEPFLMLDEGDFSVVRRAFEAEHLTPDVRYVVYDDYTILSMVQLGLGISMLYERVARGFEEQVALVPLHNAPKRRVALAWKNRDTLSYAARSFADFLLNEK